MTVILVLLFISIMISIDAIRQWKEKRAHLFVPQDIYVHEWGLTMAEGGQKIEKDSKKDEKKK